MRQVTLGGDRLGSGKKQKVELKGYERSTHNLNKIWRSTMAAGTLVPFMKIPALPGDTFDIELDVDVKTHPTVGPLFGSFKVQLDTFFAATRLYIGELHNNKLGIGMNMSAVKLPKLNLAANVIDLAQLADPSFDLNSAQINPSCIFAYLGIRGIGNQQSATEYIGRGFNGLPYLIYWDIYKNYYANKQEELGAVIHTPADPITEAVDQLEDGNSNAINPFPAAGAVTFDATNNELMLTEVAAMTQPLNQVLLYDGSIFITLAQFGTAQRLNADTVRITYDWNLWGTRTFQNYRYATPSTVGAGEIQISTFPIVNLDTMREMILAHTGTAGAFGIMETGLSPYELPAEETDGVVSMRFAQEGLAIKTYQSDLLNNWLQQEWYDDIADITKVDTTGGFFTIDQLVLAKQVWQMLNRIAVSDGTYDSWQITVYDHEPFARAETPMYMGGLIKELAFQEVVSNSESGSENGGAQPLGTLAGKGVMTGKHKGGKVHIKADEMGYVMGIVSLTPRIDYSQGNAWDTHLLTMDDFHKPQLDEIGFQDLITEQMAWWNTHWDETTMLWTTKSAGKQPAWTNYMTDINETYGNFAIPSNEMFMTLNRRYTPVVNGDEIDIEDLTTYIDPAKYNMIFAQTSLDSQNYWVQISMDITARRKMSAKVMPNL